jgi:hypothetical protein
MKVIFCDFDGVCNNLEAKDPKTIKSEPIDCRAVFLLNNLIEDTDACIVITSDWRIGHTLDWLQTMLKLAGLKYPEKVIVATINLPKQQRGKEIKTWINAVGGLDSFVILDDKDDMDPYKDHLVQTSCETGLVIEDVEKAKKILNG